MVRLRHARTFAIIVAATVVSGGLSTAGAQQRGTPTPTTGRLVVVNFRSVGADKGAGVAAADAVRDRLMREFSARQLWVIPRKDIDNALKQSGYPTDEPLNPNDARTLANLMRADEYVDGVVLEQGGEYKVEARLVLSRNLDLAQPLPVQTVSKPARPSPRRLRTLATSWMRKRSATLPPVEARTQRLSPPAARRSRRTRSPHSGVCASSTS